MSSCHKQNIYFQDSDKSAFFHRVIFMRVCESVCQHKMLLGWRSEFSSEIFLIKSVVCLEIIQSANDIIFRAASFFLSYTVWNIWKKKILIFIVSFRLLCHEAQFLFFFHVHFGEIYKYKAHCLCAYIKMVCVAQHRIFIQDRFNW